MKPTTTRPVGKIAAVVVGIVILGGLATALALQPGAESPSTQPRASTPGGQVVVSGGMVVGAGPWRVAVTPDGQQAYVTNRGGLEGRGSTVSVVNTATNQVTGTIDVGVGPAGVAVTPDGTRAYVTNERQNTVTVLTLS